MGDSYSSSASLRGMWSAIKDPEKSAQSLSADAVRQGICIEEDAFLTLLTLERRRAERSLKPFVLLLLDIHQDPSGLPKDALQEAIPVVRSCIRETDLLGWYKKGQILAAIFTELGGKHEAVCTDALRTKVKGALEEGLGRDKADQFAMSFHAFPEKVDPQRSDWSADAKLYPDVQSQPLLKRSSLAIKRAMDFSGSLALLVLISPILAVIAILIKLTSDGPVLFTQERLGRFGKRFKCLKFRTMRVNCDSQIHKEYVQNLIAGKDSEDKENADAPAVYKITSDPRVTWIGRFLRKSSLDELPQFWNVLCGDMSLVGPRPSIPYEFAMYRVWHRRRVLEVRPGITGLWQISGRSRMRFDEMVRLDVRYCQYWSLWLDLKILLATPGAVFSGDGAY